MSKIKLIGLSGRAGAGKSTVAEFIAPTSPVVLSKYNNPWAYILSNLFGWKYDELDQFIEVSTNPNVIRSCCSLSNLPDDPIWHKSVLDAFDWTYSALQKFDPDIMNHITNEFEAPEQEHQLNAKWIQISFADPLKRICIPLSGLSYPILLGVDYTGRTIRELPINQVVPDFWHPTLSGRQMLEQIGTDVFRSVDDEIWIKLAKRRINEYNARGIGVVISDVRFRNEADMIRNAGGQLWFISRQPGDLVLSDDDQKTHVSKWEFLTFIDVDNDIIILNRDSITNLLLKVSILLY